MPNGDEKNLGRLYHSIDGFRAVHQKWPTRVRLSGVCLEDLRSYLSEQQFSKVATRIEFVADGSEFIVEDDHGRSFSYDEQLRQHNTPPYSQRAANGRKPRFRQKDELLDQHV